MITDKELLQYHLWGFVPGSKESEYQFLKRVNYCKQLKNNLDESIEACLNAPASEELTQEVFSEAFIISEKIYDIKPSWIPLMFSNYKLAPWHGGCAWIFQVDAETPPGALLQLRQRYRSAKSLYGFYPRSQLVAHEFVHIGRMVFEESKFEEMLAYQTSSSWITRNLGPIVESSKESVFFVLILGLIFGINIFLYYHQLLSFPLLLLPVAIAGYAFWRLWRKRTIFNKCMDNLTECLTNKTDAQHVIFRLTDEEITNFATFSPEKIKSTFRQNRDTSLRWRLLNLAYFEQENGTTDGHR